MIGLGRHEEYRCLVTATCAVCAAAASSALALAIVLCQRLDHYGADVALLSLNDQAVSFLHTLALVSAIAVATLVSHGEFERVEN